jgi:hypothetical protein
MPGAVRRVGAHRASHYARDGGGGVANDDSSMALVQHDWQGELEGAAGIASSKVTGLDSHRGGRTAWRR